MAKERRMAEIKLDNVSKFYGDLGAVKESSWVAEQGEFIVLFGPSGAGKTTTLEMIAGLEKVDQGEIYFDDQAMAEIETADRDVSMAFENYALYPHLSVFENIAFPLKIPGRRGDLSEKEINKRVVEIAEVLQIEMLLERPPQQLSGGQRQRVALGRCLVRTPQACLLDEPIAHLDAKLRHRMYAELKRIQRERGVTTIYATPAQSEAMAMADRIVIMFDGVVQQVASPRELYECPGSVDVAKFGGEQPMNILPISIGDNKGKRSFTMEGQVVDAPEQLIHLIKKFNVAKDVLLGVRPPDLKIVFKDDGDHLITSELYAVEQLGRTARITVKVGDKFLEVASKDHIDAKIGDKIWLSLDESPVYLFDAQDKFLIASADLAE
jgi:multiple sugar transport system ATP-binding protein